MDALGTIGRALLQSIESAIELIEPHEHKISN